MWIARKKNKYLKINVLMIHFTLLKSNQIKNVYAKGKQNVYWYLFKKKIFLKDYSQF